MRYELLENRHMLSASVEVLNPIIEPGQDVPVQWELSRAYVDTDSNGIIEQREIGDLTIVLDALGGIKNHVEFTPSLAVDSYLNTDGNLVGVATVPIPSDAALGEVFQVWMTVDNGVGLPIAVKSPVPINLVSGEDEGAGALVPPFSANYRDNVFGGPVTQLAQLYDRGDSTGDLTTIRVLHSSGFPTSGDFDVWVTNASGDSFRATVTLTSGNLWEIEIKESSGGLTFPAGSKVALDPLDIYAARSGVSRELILDYVETINGDDGEMGSDRNIADERVRALIARSAAITELRSDRALTEILQGNLGNLVQRLDGVLGLDAVLGTVFNGEVKFSKHTPFDPTMPTVVLVHGIRTSPDGDDGFFGGVVDRIGAFAEHKFNVLGFAWGETNFDNGLDRTIDVLLDGAVETNAKGLTLQAAVNLNKVLRFLDRTYVQVGSGGGDKVSIISHSQGAVVTTLALTLDPTILNTGFTFGVSQSLFIGANLNRAATLPRNSVTLPQGGELSRIPTALRSITNLYSAHDAVVLLGATLRAINGSDHDRRVGAGNDGFVKTSLPGVSSWNVEPLDTGLEDEFAELAGFPDEDRTVVIQHTGPVRPFLGQVRVGWWRWLETLQRETSFITSGLRNQDGFAGVAKYLTEHGAFYAIDAQGLPANTDVPLGYDLRTGVRQISPLQPTIDHVDLSSPSGPGFGANSGSGSGGPATLTANQGDYFIAEAIGAVDPDGYIFRADFYRDVNGNGLPDDNGQEYLGTDFHPGNGWKRAIYTANWALGTYDIIAQVFDNGGNPSNIKVATVEVVDPTLPAGPLPLSFDNSQQPQFNIIPHRNGDVSYDPALFRLVPGRLDLWQITPQTGGGFNFETTGDTDTVLGLYDWANGNLLAVDEDNGLDNNAEVTYTLAAGHTYVLIVASQQGDSGAYGLDVTGGNQTITATPVFAAPLYEAAVAESIAAPFELDYFKATVPVTTTTLNVALDVGTGLNGWVRVENAAHETLATAFLAGPGDDESLMAVAVTPGEDVFITVAALEGTIGSYTLNVDFGPDEPGVPGTMDPPPVDGIRLVPQPDGTFILADESIATPGQFRSYQFSTRNSAGGEYTFETSGDLDTQIGVYQRHSAANSTLIMSDDDSGGGENARLTVNLNGGDDYIIIVRGEGGDTGDFDLSVAGPPVSPSNLIISGLALELTTSYSSLANNNRFFHYQVLAPENATTMTLQTKNSVSSPDLDISLRVSDINGNVLAIADGVGPGGVESIVDLSIVAGETYYVTVYSEDYSVGDARISINFDPDFAVGSGVEFPVNSTFFGSQRTPDVARNSSDQSVAVWMNPDFQRIDSQRFGLDHQPVGAEFQVNATPIEFNSRPPAVGIADNGNFVALFGDNNNLNYRVFDFNGAPLTGDVNAGFAAGNADIAIEPNGRFLIVGVNNNQVLGRLYDAGGTALTAPLVLHNATRPLFDPAVAIDGEGRFIITWVSNTGAPQFKNNIYAIRVDASGNVLDDVFQVGASFAGSSTFPAVAAHSDGTFVIVFDGDPGDGTARNIYAQRFGADASPDGDLLLVNTVVSGNQVEPSVAILSQGKFLVAWRGIDANVDGIRAQQIGVNMERLGPEFTLNQTETGTQQSVSLASDGNEHVIAAWEGPDASVEGIYGLDFALAEVQESEITVTDTSGDLDDRFVDFGSRVAEVGGMVSGFMPATITIKNEGNAPLVVDSIDVYGADATAFELSDASAFVLNPGERRIIDVTFIGTDLGEYYAAVRLDHNDNSDVLSRDFDADPFWVSVLAKIETPFEGDYDENGTVDHLDYGLWKSSYGESGNDLPADGNHDSVVDAADYTVWRNNLGATLFPPQPPELLGDYNGNGAVDAADYTVWRNSLGSFVTHYSGADGDGNGIIQSADYDVWKANYGNSLLVGSGSARTTWLDEATVATGPADFSEVSADVRSSAIFVDLRTVGLDPSVASNSGGSLRMRAVADDVSARRVFSMQRDLMAALMDSIAVEHSKMANYEASSDRDLKGDGSDSFIDAVDRVFEDVGTKHCWDGVDSAFRKQVQMRSGRFN